MLVTLILFFFFSSFFSRGGEGGRGMRMGAPLHLSHFLQATWDFPGASEREQSEREREGSSDEGGTRCQIPAQCVICVPVQQSAL